MEKYIKLYWPESQKFMEYEECYTITNTKNDSITFVPENLYDEITYKNQFPKEYDTNIGKITCYENCAIIDKHKPFMYDRKIKKGDKLLLYVHDSDEWIISKCMASNLGLPIVIEDRTLLIGINCELIGSYNPNYDN